MSFDLVLVIGCILAVLSVVAVLTARIEGRRPRVASVVAVIAGALILWAVLNAPGGFQFRDIPDAFINVVAAMLN
ncbi:MAG: hypothetical protein ACE5DK_09030 [Paracoccaceae bacterium]